MVHTRAINSALHASSGHLRRTRNGSDGRHVIPGWNEAVREVHQEARSAYVMWRNTGKPRIGPEHTTMQLTRRRFKLCLRRCRAEEEQHRADALARSLEDKDCKGFWREISAMNDSKMPLPTCIDGCRGEASISGMWRDHYKNVMNSVHNASAKPLLQSRICDLPQNNDQRINSDDVKEALRKAKKGKACGLDGLASEHFIYADECLSVLLALFFSATVSHGHLPHPFMLSAVLPIIKSKTGDSTAKSNYRPVAIVSACSKLMECIILQKTELLLSTNDSQFGFKKHHSTDLCLFTLKSTISFYTSQNSPVSCCFLDASKAFDRVNHWTLFNKLCERNVPLILIRLLLFWYTTQQICIKWGNSLSECFNVSNGVRQGSILSPKLFSIYVEL